MWPLSDPGVEDQAAGEDPLEAEKIEAALLKQGYFSDAIPLPMTSRT